VSAPRSANVVMSAAALPMPKSSVPIGRLSVDVKGKTLTPLGLWFGIMSFAWAFVMYPPLLLATAISLIFDKQRRRPIDFVVRIWAKFAMLTCGYWPRVVGAENLPALNGNTGFMVVPNHCAFLDILTLSGFLPRPLKYVSKVEILDIPLIGWAMQWAGHIAIRRGNRRSQLQTFKDTVTSLQDGNAVVTFAEGTRSNDGRLKTFKKGPFTMATKAGVDVVPISLVNIWKWYPTSALAPLGRPRDVEIRIHPPVSTVGLTDDQVREKVFAAVNGGLPSDQQATPEVVAEHVAKPKPTKPKPPPSE